MKASVSNKQIRKKALEILSVLGWKNAVFSSILTLFPIFVSLVISYFAFFEGIILFLIISPLLVGSCGYFLNASKGIFLPVSAVFDPLKKYFNCLLLGIYNISFVFAVSIIPTSVAFFLARYKSYTFDTYASFFALTAIILIVFSGMKCLFCYFSYGESFGSNSPLSAFKEGLKRVSVLRAFSLLFSFWGWAVLCILTFGIGFFFLIPYIFTSFALLYQNS